MIFSSINIREIHNNSKKFKGSNFLTKGFHYKKIIVKNNYKKLNEVANYISNIGINNRNYVLNKDFGYPFISNTILSNNDPSTLFKYVSKKLNKNVEGKFIEENMLLFAGIGSIGDIAFGSKDIIGCLTPLGNVIRVRTINYPGYFYAFFKSKIGNALILNLESGSVQTYLDPTTLGNLPVPILPEEKQQQIHQLIVDSANLRVEANKLLKEAVEFFKFLDTTYKAGTYNVKNISSNTINNFKKRFDANYNIINNYVDNIKSNQKIEFIKINELTENIFIGPRSKRNYISNGIPFLSTSEMQKANPTKTEKFVNQNVGKDFQVKEGWLLTTRSGTLGDTIYTLPCINNFAVSEDAIRIQFKQHSILSNKYVYAFLKSNLGRNSLLAGSYGSVILHLNEDYVGNVEVPILEKNTIKEIEEKIDLHLFNLNEAIIKENQAINLIENEIDAWQ